MAMFARICFRTIAVLAFSFGLRNAAFGQALPYPIIFVHGLNGDDGTWRETIEYFRDNFGWDDPYANDQGIFHALLNASDLSTHLDLDVKTDFPNEHNELYNGQIYAINFRNWWNPVTEELLRRRNRSSIFDNDFSESNESAIAKQGMALGQMIKRVIEATGADKVILVCHSMGGLAAREYLQRIGSDGLAKWWAFPQSGGHRVAKLVTIGTPHAGSNMPEFGIAFINRRSEAARDLFYNYDQSGPPNFDVNPDNGIYLFGGNETDVPAGRFLDRDLDCSGGETSTIIGLNSHTIVRRDNEMMPLPSEVDYTFVVSDWDLAGNGDGAVRLDRQFLELDSPPDTLWIHKHHLDETGDYRAIIRGLDEPDDADKAYTIDLSQPIHGFTDYPGNNGVADHDWFRFNLINDGNVRISLKNITPISNSNNVIMELFRQSDLNNLLAEARNGGSTEIAMTSPALNSGPYLIHLRSVVASGAWQTPYALEITPLVAPTHVFLYANRNSLPINGATATLYAELRMPDGNVNATATNPVSFAILSGSQSATLVGPTVVNAVNGVATITLQSTGVPGVVALEASSPGLASGNTTITVYGNPTQVSGSITVNTTWRLANSPYQVTGDIDVRPGVTLTIDPGVVVMFDNGRDLTINGTLLANGAAALPVSFTSSSANPVPSSWGGLRINQPQSPARSRLSCCHFRYGGAGGFDNYDDVVEISGYAEPAVTGCTIADCRRNGIEMLGGTYSSNFRVNVTDLPLMVLGDVTVASGATMTVDPEVHFKFGSGANIFVNGALSARGTAGQRIVFTSLKDDLVDGDTDATGPTSGQMGDWGGLSFGSSVNDAGCVLEYCDLKFAGQGGFGDLDAPIRIDARANPTFRSLRFTDCRVNGVSIHPSRYESNIRFDQTAAPYVLQGDLTVAPGAILTIGPGTLFKLAPEVDMGFEGGLVCRGTAANPIRFTALRDDSRGGDTGNDGETFGSEGDWGGLEFGSTVSGSVMDYTEFHFGGGGGYGNVGSPMLLDLRAEITFSNLTIANCTSNGITVRSMNYTTDTRMRYPGNTPYISGYDISIAQGSRLTIEPGCVIKMKQEVDLFVNGGLIAEGTAQAPIIFTSFDDDSTLGDTNNDGRSQGSARQWGGLSFGSTAINAACRVRHCQFRFGGVGGYGNVGWIIQVSPLVNPAFSNLSFHDNSSNGIHLSPGSFNSAITFDQMAAPYLLWGDYTIEPSGGLTINAGTLFKIWHDSDIYVKSRLTAVGTEVSPIVFTSFRDDSQGGDTNNDGVSAGVAGDWGGIFFQSQSFAGASEVAYCELWYGASAGYGNSDAALWFEGSSQKVHHTKIAQMRWQGVRANNGATPDLGGGALLSPGFNSFLGFSGGANRFAVYNDGSATIFAKNNIWDGASAAAIAKDIYDKFDNASKGEVIFQPFIPAGDSEAPQVSVLFPNGGETFLLGASALLRWYVRDNVGVANVTVTLSRDGGQIFQPLASLSGAQEELAWTVQGPLSSLCLLKVTGQDAAGNERFDLSDNFFAIADSGGGINYPPSIPLPLRPLAGEEMLPSDLLIWQASSDPNPFDRIVYRLEIDNDASFSSPELVQDNIDSSLTSGHSLKDMPFPIVASGDVLAVRLGRLSGYANLVDDLLFFWRVRARDDHGATSAFSAGTHRFFNNRANSAPHAVDAGFSPRDGVEIRVSRPEVSWHPAHDPDPSDHSGTLRYNLQMNEVNDFSAGVRFSYQTQAGLATFETSDNLDENRLWYWRVQTLDDEGLASNWSAVQSFWVNALDEPPSPFALIEPANQSSFSGDSLRFRWESTFDPDPGDRFAFRLELAADSLFSSVLQTIAELNDTSVVIATAELPAARLFWRVQAIDVDKKVRWGSNSDAAPWYVDLGTTAVDFRQTASLPSRFELSQNYPNPFNPHTIIEFALPQPSHVTIRVFDLLGKEVVTLVDKFFEAGYQRIIWDGRDTNGKIIPSGIYLYKIEAGEFSAIKKSVVVH